MCRWICLLLLCLLWTPVYAQPTYTMRDLGRFIPHGQNDAGDLVGHLGDEAVIWLQGQAPFSLGFGRAEGINNARQVVGSLHEQPHFGFVWSQATGVVFLQAPDVGEGILIDPFAINDAGVIVGSYWGPPGEFGAVPVAFAYPPPYTQMILLPAPGFPGSDATAWSINGQHEIAGQSSGAFRCTLSPLACADLGQIGPYAFAGAYAISDRPETVGFSSDTILTSIAMSHTDAEGMQALGTHPGWHYSSAHGINDSANAWGLPTSS
jgi:hypothetical protein